MPELLERDGETGCLGRLVHSAASGAGGLVLIEGDAGIGKTGLVRLAAALADDAGLRVLRARGAELERDLAFGVVRELLGSAVASVPGVWNGAAALAAPVLHSDSGSSAEGRDLFAALHGLHWLTADLGGVRPLLLVVDDGQWCDLPSLRFLAYLARRLEGLPVGLLVAARPPEAQDRADLLGAVADEPLATVLRPRPLGLQAVETVVAGTLGPPDHEFGSACRIATGGNPFLLGELLAELAAAGVVPRATEVDRLTAVVPRGVRRALVARLGRLTAEAAALARAAAVLGDGADARLAALLAGIPNDDVAGAIDTLVTARLVERDTALTFLHPLLRAAVASTLGPAELSLAHRRVVTIMAEQGEVGDALVSHLLAARPAGDPWIVESLRAAAQRATSRGAPEVAVRYLGRALSEPPPRHVRYPLLIELGTAEMRAGAVEAVEHLDAALDEAPDACSRAGTQLLLARIAFHTGRMSDAVRVCERAIAELDGAVPDLAMELEAQLLTAATGSAATRQVAVRWFARRPDDPEPTSRAGCMLLALLAVEEVIVSGSRERALELAEGALTDARLLDDHAVVTLPSAMITLILAGRADRATQVMDRVIEQKRSRGDVHGFAFASAFRGHAAHHTGDLTGAVADLRRAVEISRGVEPLSLSEGFATAWLACALIDTGDVEGADEELAAAPKLMIPGSPFTGTFLFSARGQVRLAQGRFDEAVADLEECGRRMAEWGATSPVLSRWRPYLALALLGRGEHERAAEIAGDAVHRAREWDTPFVLAEALRVAGLVAAGEPGLILLREAVEVAAPAPLEHARALTALGTVLLRSGQRAAARAPLRKALDLALARGASGIARLAHDELVTSGARPRRLRATGAAALTATERRVAGMAADGSTNRAVAQALFVSEKTVETHLGHTYRKLGIAARSQLAGALGAGSGA